MGEHGLLAAGRAHPERSKPLPPVKAGAPDDERIAAPDGQRRWEDGFQANLELARWRLAADGLLSIRYSLHGPHLNLLAYCTSLEDRAKSAPGVTDPGGWGYSLANLTELMFPCLEAIETKSVVEIGAYRGELTRELLGWATGSGARVTAVDPEPPPQLLKLADEQPELELVRQTSHDALASLALPDALIIDGDHNYYTLTEELRLIDSRAPGAELPLLDVPRRRLASCPAGHLLRPRADPGRAPPAAGSRRLPRPGETGVADGGLPFEWAAMREGGPQNGVLTALEDFVAERVGLRLAVVSAFFGVRRPLASRCALGRAPLRRSSTRGTATPFSSGSRPTGSRTWRPGTSSRWSWSRLDAASPSRRSSSVRCSNRGPSRSRSGCRGYTSGRARPLAPAGQAGARRARPGVIEVVVIRSRTGRRLSACAGA